jgi:hypothetical protein
MQVIRRGPPRKLNAPAGGRNVFFIEIPVGGMQEHLNR